MNSGAGISATSDVYTPAEALKKRAMKSAGILHMADSRCSRRQARCAGCGVTLAGRNIDEETESLEEEISAEETNIADLKDETDGEKE